jgi:hypothetical protein
MRWRWRFQSGVTCFIYVYGVHSPGMFHDVLLLLWSWHILRTATFLRASGWWDMPVFIFTGMHYDVVYVFDSTCELECSDIFNLILVYFLVSLK